MLVCVYNKGNLLYFDGMVIAFSTVQWIEFLWIDV